MIGGVFSDRGFILGKVFLDCNANGLQDRGEPGVPGVRLFLEDGTFVITDGEGKYSFYGIPNRTHVLKVDRTTLPAGATLAADERAPPGRRRQPHRGPEVRRAAPRRLRLAGCEPAVVDDVKARAKAIAERADELARPRRHAARHRGARRRPT